MTSQERFKRRIRARMAKTGERYTAALRAMTGDRALDRGVAWESDPEMSDEAVRSATGRSWDEWCALIDAGPHAEDGHAAIAAWLVADGVDGWWAQTITVGYERIRGLRLPGEMSDGTFSANKSRTVSVDAALLRSLLLDEQARADLFPAVTTELRSRATSKAIRLAVGSGVAVITLTGREDDRTTVTIQHTRLPTRADIELWKNYWSDWLDALDS